MSEAPFVEMKFVDFQIAGEIRDVDALRALCESIQATFYSGQSWAEGEDGIKRIADLILTNSARDENIQIQQTIRALSDCKELKAVCESAGLSYQILEAFNGKQDGYDLIRVFEPENLLGSDGKEHRYSISDDFEPYLSLTELMNANSKRLSLQEVISRAASAMKVIERAGHIQLDPAIFDQLSVSGPKI